ncbi:CS domain-containing protein [Caerostris extrusa]|uniref:CS domain-containing protein n=1 Tax=Caerostris extrusa TaxID=172846 RepID=A0AAV4QKT1_CAEEX|nr:CS domain-containing protein [Caerostris extrusa]
MGTSDIRMLVNLLNLGNEEKSDNEDEFGLKKKKKSYYTKLKNSKDIWLDDEVLDEDYDEFQSKDKPQYEMIYQQKVTPDDIFLQLSGKGPGSNSCEGLLVKIKLDDTNSSDEIDLKISDTSMVCKTQKYYLDFPRNVDPEKCSAKWDQTTKCLEAKLAFIEDGMHL